MISRSVLMICLCSSFSWLILFKVVEGDTTASLTLLSDDVFSSNTKMVKFCPNSKRSVEFMCVAQNLTTLRWRKNSTFEIYEIHQRSVSWSNGSYTVYVDSDNTSLNNYTLRFDVITSRLKVADRSDVHNGDKIECVAYVNRKPTTVDYLIIDYTGIPSMPKLADIIITGWTSDALVDVVNITFIWDDDFNTDNAITMYLISVTDPLVSSSATNIACPGTCSPDEMYTCSGSLARTGVNVNIMAVNCEDQQGPPIVVTIKKCQTEPFGTHTISPTDSRCKPPGSKGVLVPNGFVCFDGLTAGSVATFLCNDGYTLFGKKQLMCQNNGSWIGDTPQCKPDLYGWTIAVVAFTGIALLLSIILSVVWSILFCKAEFKTQWYKICIYMSLLSVAVFLLLLAIILGILNYTVNAPSGAFAISALLTSMLDVAWLLTNTIFCCIWRKRFKWVSKCCSKDDDNDMVRIEKENELYYLGRSKCHNEPEEERIYDSISQKSDITDWEDSCTDSEGYIKTRSHKIHLEPDESMDMGDYLYSDN